MDTQTTPLDPAIMAGIEAAVAKGMQPRQEISGILINRRIIEHNFRISARIIRNMEASGKLRPKYNPLDSSGKYYEMTEVLRLSQSEGWARRNHEVNI